MLHGIYHDTWYLIGLAAGAIVLALSALETKQTWVAVDRDVLHLIGGCQAARTADKVGCAPPRVAQR